MFAETLGMRLRGAYLTFHRLAGAVFEPLGITADQFVVLATVGEEAGLTQRQIVLRTQSDPNTIAAILKRLEGQALVGRPSDPDDRRARRVHLTPKGRALLRRLQARTPVLRDRLDGLFTPEELQTLGTLLARVPPAMLAAGAALAENRSSRSSGAGRPAADSLHNLAERT